MIAHQKVVISFMDMEPEQIPDMSRFTNDRWCVAAYQDQYAVRQVYEFPTQRAAEACVNAVLSGSPATSATMLPDMRNITLLRWMSQYPGVALMFWLNGEYVVPIPEHRTIFGMLPDMEKLPSDKAGACIKCALRNGFKAMILDGGTEVPDPNPMKCAACGVETDDPAGKCWLTVGHPTNDGTPLPYPICDHCQQNPMVVADFVNDSIGTVKMSAKLPKTIGFAIRITTPDKKLPLYWSNGEPGDLVAFCSRESGRAVIFNTPADAGKVYADRRSDMFGMNPVIVPMLAPPEPPDEG